MKIIRVGHEPLLPVVFYLGAYTVIIALVTFFTKGFFSTSFLFIEITLIIINFCISILNKIAEISEEGIKMDDYFIKWGDIVSWSYSPPGKMSRNQIEITTEMSCYKIRGFNEFLVISEFRKYALGKEKEEGLGFTGYWTLFLIGLPFLVLVIWVTETFNK